jgi:hypothetical protein
MSCSFTQTYSNNRDELFYYHNRDKTDIYFRSKLNKNYYVFHNSPESYKEKITQNNYFKDIKNIDFVSYENINYTQSLYNSLQNIKQDGYKYVFFLQDDAFSFTTENIIDELLDFVNNNSFDMLNLEKLDINLEAPIIYSNNHLKVYNTTSDDFKNKNLWAFDDGPYVANIDFLINDLYDSIYFSKKDIWNGERYLNDKITNNKIQRLSTNINIFERVTLIGANVCHSNRENELIKLNNIFI